MGMNYYLTKKDSSYHIAKASQGWPVLFQAHKTPEHWPTLQSLNDIAHYVNMRGYKIYDETSQEVLIDDFIELVRIKKNELPKSRQNKVFGVDLKDWYTDSEGNPFTYEEFS